MNQPSSTLSEYSNMTAPAKTEPKMNPNKKDLHVVELLQKSIRTRNPCLDFSYERLGDAGAMFLARRKDLSHVTQLNLSWNELTSKGLEDLAQCRSLGSLTTLILDSNEIGDEGALAIAESKTLGEFKSSNIDQKPG